MTVCVFFGVNDCGSFLIVFCLDMGMFEVRRKLLVFSMCQRKFVQLRAVVVRIRSTQRTLYCRPR